MKNLFMSALALMGLGAMGTDAAAQFYVIKDGKVVYALEQMPDYVEFPDNKFSVSKDDKVVYSNEQTPDYFTFENPMPCGGAVGEAVDLGLSVKWASWNVGASKPEGYGNYYAWGETETKKNYSWSSYKFIKSGESNWYYISKYQSDDHYYEGVWYKDAKYHNNGGKTTLDASDDAAAANWKGDWVMPTAADWLELKTNCDGEWKSDYKGNGSNIAGWLFTSKTNGKTIFLPATGLFSSSSVSSKGSCGFYWSSSLNVNSKYGNDVYFKLNNFSTSNYGSRYFGEQVRPVCPASGDTNDHNAVDLGLPSGKLWATCNVGASAPEENGSYFAWGETTAKSKYTWDNYIGEPAKYEGDNTKTLGSADDVATLNWGSEWRMPTEKEWYELSQNTTRTWTDNYNGTGVKGYILTSKVAGHTDASIFFPAAGIRADNTLVDGGANGFYWSSTLPSDFSYYGGSLRLYLNYFNTSYSYRYYGCSVRPVCAK